MQASVTDNSQLAWQHAHPFLMVAFSTLGTLAVLTGILLVRWLVLRKAWRHHPRGAVWTALRAATRDLSPTLPTFWHH